MPTTHVPPQSSGPPPIKLPICPTCGDPTPLTSIEPHDRFRNLDVRNFRCDAATPPAIWSPVLTSRSCARSPGALCAVRLANDARGTSVA